MQHFPELQIWDHAVELKPNAPSMIPGKVYQLTQDEQKALLDFVKEQQAKGYVTGQLTRGQENCREGRVSVFDPQDW